MAKVLRRIGVLSCAKITGIIYTVVGMVVGLCISIFSLLIAAFGGFAGQGREGVAGALFGVAAVIFFPILYGVLGFLGGALTAWLYNVFAGLVGGIQLEIEEQPSF